MDELGTLQRPDQGEHLADDEVVGDEATTGLSATCSNIFATR